MKTNTTKGSTGKRVTFNLPSRMRKRAHMNIGGKSTLLMEDNAGIMLAVFVLMFTIGAAIAWPKIIPKATTVNENYVNFGGVGAKLRGQMAPQEYMGGNTTAMSAGNRYVVPDAIPNVEDTDNEVLDPTDLSKKASSALSASAARVLADMSTSTVDISTPPMADPSQQEGRLNDQIKYATKGDGIVRPVSIDRNPISKELVQLAMFENQDFMFRHEDPELPPLPHLQDPSSVPQRSHFGPMTYPLVWEKGTLGMDIIGDSNDTRATISFTGGRPPVFFT